MFNSDRDGDEDIYIMKADGTEVRRLTNNNLFDCCTDWSTDGTKIAFNSSWPDGDQDILVINSDGSGLKNLTNAPGDDWNPAWSPDGTRIAFDARRDGQAEIYVMNADGTEPVRLTRHASAQRAARWSPDGQFLVYQSNQDETNPDKESDDEIYIMKRDGSAQVRLTSQASNNDRGPDWSKNGLGIAYTAYQGGIGEIFAINPDGTDIRQVTNHPADDSDVRWRP